MSSSELVTVYGAQGTPMLMPRYVLCILEELDPSRKNRLGPCSELSLHQTPLEHPRIHNAQSEPRQSSQGTGRLLRRDPSR